MATSLLKYLRIIAIFEFFEYHEDFSRDVIQHVKEWIQEVLSRLIFGLQLVTDSFKEQVTISVFYPYLRVWQRDLFETTGFAESQKVLGH